MVIQSMASDTPWSVGAAGGSTRAANDRSARPFGRRTLHAVVGALEDVGLLLLVVCLVPMTILLLGMPVALVIMLLTAIARI